jgi:formylglycine-generating enzyme required for sulfatase activity
MLLLHGRFIGRGKMKSNKLSQMHAAGRSRVNEVMASLVLVGLILACGSTAGTATEIPEEAATAEPTIATTPTLGIGSSMTREADGMTLLLVPEGEFTMGNDSSNFEREIPAHEVFLDAYWIDQTEITNVMYATCVAADGCKPPKETKSFTYPEYFANPDFDDYPVVYVSWDSATAYCTWAGGRLPTEAEWEKAARGTDRRIYPWGNDWDPAKVNSAEGGSRDTTPVGQYSLAGDSPYGCADMAGNVWEWCADWFDEKEYQRRAASRTTVKDPQGPEKGTTRVLRGGSFFSSRGNARAAVRAHINPGYWKVNDGFRVVSASPAEGGEG